jgi:hypothetical protein
MQILVGLGSKIYNKPVLLSDGVNTEKLLLFIVITT